MIPILQTWLISKGAHGRQFPSLRTDSKENKGHSVHVSVCFCSSLHTCACLCMSVLISPLSVVIQRAPDVLWGCQAPNLNAKKGTHRNHSKIMCFYDLGVCSIIFKKRKELFFFFFHLSKDQMYLDILKFLPDNAHMYFRIAL